MTSHPDGEDKGQLIGWQPVYSTNHQSPSKNSSPTSPLIWGVCLAVALISICLSGGLLWSKANKSDVEMEAKIQDALVRQKEEITECITTAGQATQTQHKEKEPRLIRTRR